MERIDYLQKFVVVLVVSSELFAGCDGSRESHSEERAVSPSSQEVSSAEPREESSPAAQPTGLSADTQPVVPAAIDYPEAEEMLEKWGVEVLNLSHSAGGYMLDFRFRVVDPAKAQPLLAKSAQRYLVHAASGARLMVPSSGKVGPLRQVTDQPEANMIYWTLFANPGVLVKQGDRVTVHIGEFVASDLVVQ